MSPGRQMELTLRRKLKVSLHTFSTHSFLMHRVLALKKKFGLAVWGRTEISPLFPSPYFWIMNESDNEGICRGQPFVLLSQVPSPPFHFWPPWIPHSCPTYYRRMWGIHLGSSAVENRSPGGDARISDATWTVGNTLPAIVKGTQMGGPPSSPALCHLGICSQGVIQET